MIYLAWYHGIGAAVLIAIVIAHRISKKTDLEFSADFLTTIHPERKKLWYRILNDVIGPGLIGILVVPFWPVILFFKIRQLISGETDKQKVEDTEFAVGHPDLLEKVTIPDVEQRERVVDPLGAVPDLPFGHLNAAWRKFIDSGSPTDEIWTFSAHWVQWGRKELRQGYAIVHEDVIVQHFLTSWKDVEEKSNEVKKAKLPFDLAAWLRSKTD